MLLSCARDWSDHLRTGSRGCSNLVVSGNHRAGCGRDGGDDVWFEPLSINRLPLVETTIPVLRDQNRQDPLKMSIDLGLGDLYSRKQTYSVAATLVEPCPWKFSTLSDVRDELVTTEWTRD
jgi:hypothetical protein